jgi:hypothetical protein
MKWKKLGNVFCPNNSPDEFLISHAANPLPVWKYGNVFTVFYSGRDNKNKSSVGYMELDIDTLSVVNAPQEAVFKYGDDDSFYSHGVSIGNCYQADGQSYIGFMGWQCREGQHWRGDIGRLRIAQSNALLLDPQVPMMDTALQADEISLSYPFVLFHEGEYKMWYGATISWDAGNGEMLHIIKYATSKNGLDWQRKGNAIPYELNIAQAFSRPSVLIDKKGKFHIWYSYRSGNGTPYRIGYSTSANGIDWINRLDEVGIDVSKDGWDSDMLCYPFVFKHQNHVYMLYNGNGYGKTGFGLAILEESYLF